MAIAGRSKGSKNRINHEVMSRSISLPKIYWEALETYAEPKGVSAQKCASMFIKAKIEKLGIIPFQLAYLAEEV